MLAKAQTCALSGLDGFTVQVETDISPGLPSFSLVGLPDAAVQEAKERVRAAIRNSGCEFPMRRITVNLAPADLRKAGPAYDLPIAVALLRSSGQLPELPPSTVFLGELSLDGTLNHTSGIVAMVVVAREEGFKQVFVPAPDATEAALVEGVRIVAATNLESVVAHLRGEASLSTVDGGYSVNGTNGHKSAGQDGAANQFDMSDVRGQEHAKRALEIAAAGGHNLLMSGPPGSGKTLLARCLPSILPPLTHNEALEVTKIYSVSGLLSASTPLVTKRPFRSPHYTISNVGLVGGGRQPKPGEITLSHRGVLFLDEFPEFGRSVLEVLRQPLEDKNVTISRAQGSTTYPANFMLVGAMNPCTCGYAGDPTRQCSCAPSEVSRYQRRISGPLMDRIDLFIDVPRVEFEKLRQPSTSESSESVRLRVNTAREVQLKRFVKTHLLTNADMGPVQVWNFCQAEDSAGALLKGAVNQLNLSARAYHRILKVARSIADLAGAERIAVTHVAEALQYRPRFSE
jgi:magnesium chelatase family protein